MVRASLRPEALPAGDDGDLRRAVVASPSTDTAPGRRILDEDPDCTGSLGHRDQRGGRGRGHARRHQVRARQRAQPRAAAPDGGRPGGASSSSSMAGDEPDVVIGCVGGGSNFAGLAFPFLADKCRGGRQIRGHRRRAGRLPHPDPRPLRLRLRRHREDGARSCKMHTLGHGFVPPAIHSGGLRYHGDGAAGVATSCDTGLIEARAYHQASASPRPSRFARAEGIIPAPEPAHALRARGRGGRPRPRGGRGAHDPLQPLRARALRHGAPTTRS